MSEIVTITGGASATVYGTQAAAITYLGMMLGESYDAWRALTNDQQKQALATATRHIDRRTWATAVNTFALRDAAVDAESRPVFQLASYELAAIAAADPSVLATTETGSNIRSAGAGTARVEFFRPTSVAAGTSRPLPDVVQQLIGSYLASSASSSDDGTGGYGQSGNCESAFEDSGEFTRVGPF